MTETQTQFERKSRPRLVVRMAVATLLVITATAVQGQTPSASDIAAGSQLFRQKANCQACHGWAGDGRKMDPERSRYTRRLSLCEDDRKRADGSCKVC